MASDVELEPSQPTLSVHVFGASQGESIVVEMPNDRWGVVDCYSPSLAATANPIVRFLSERRVKELDFVCLTHPHEDHYRGMSHLLNRYRTRYFWRPAAMTAKYLKWLLLHEEIDARESGNRTVKENAGELFEIFAEIGRKKKEAAGPLRVKPATLDTALYPTPDNDAGASVRIVALAPSGGQIDKYEAALANCFDDDDRLKDRLPYGHQNVISIALLIEFGKTRIILGGDVETPGWEDICAEFGVARLGCTAIKVSHHGSTTGYCDGLWRHFAGERPPVAVLTAFRRHGLPRPEGLDHISRHASLVLSPNVSAIAAVDVARIPASTKAPLESRKAMAEEFKAVPLDTRTGRCSLTFDDQGNILKHDAQPPAGQLPVGHAPISP